MKIIFTLGCFLFFVMGGYAQATYTWNISTIPSSWTNPASWTPARSFPANNDILVFNGASTPSVTVNSMPANQTVGKIRIYNNADVTFASSTATTISVGSAPAPAAPHFSVEAGSTLRLTSNSFVHNLNILNGYTGLIGGNIIFSAGSHTLTSVSANSLVFQNGSNFTATGSFTGAPFGFTNINSVVFQAGSVYTQEAGQSPFGATAPASVVTFNKNNLFIFRYSGNTPGFSGRTYANLEFDITGTTSPSGSSPARMDSLLIRNGTVKYIGAGGMIISGDLKVLSGSLLLDPSGLATTLLFDGAITQNVSGVVNFSSTPIPGSVVFAVGNLSNVNLLTSLTLLDSVNVFGKLSMNNQTVNGNAFNMYPDNISTATTTASITSGSHVVTVGSTQNFRVGMRVNVGAGFPSDTYVMKVSGSTLQLSRFATVTNPTTTISPVPNAATLGIGSAEGISAAPSATGNVLCNIRNYQARGNYEYTGGFAQVAGNGIPASVRQLSLNKSVATSVSLSKSITIDSNLNLIKGYLVSSSSSIPTFRDTTKVSSPINLYGFTNEGHFESYIKGPLNIIASTAGNKIAPIGKDGYFAPVRLTKANPGAVTYSLEYFSQPYSDVTTDTLPLDHVSKLEHWLISANTTGTVVAAKLALSWRPYSQVGNGNAANDQTALDNLVVAHYINDGAGNKWRIDGADQNLMLKNAGATVAYGMVTTNLVTANFSPFTLGTKSPFNILPLKFTKVEAIASMQKIRVNWEVQNEENARLYELERSSDGVHFELAGSMLAKQLAFAGYEAEDLNYQKGWNYYRIKGRDKNSRIFYSKVARAWAGGNAPLVIYPNPVKDELRINLPYTGSVSEIKIVNVQGETVKRFTTRENTVIIPVSNLSPGNYYLRVTNESNTYTRTFMKQ